MSKPRAVDCQAFAGGFTLGVVQAGFDLVGKREQVGGFGVANCEANRALLGDKWEAEAVDPADWTVPSGRIDLVFGNPPCSGFSTYTPHAHRGIDAAINAYMWAFVRYAARMAPPIVMFESVRQAYGVGRSLMLELRAELETLTGKRYELTHVLVDAHTLGGPAIRRRYFWVASRVPFGAAPPPLPFLATVADALGDLEPLALTWARQPYRARPTRWSDTRRSPSGFVDGHVVNQTPGARRLAALLAEVPWEPGARYDDVLAAEYAARGHLPEAMRSAEALLAAGKPTTTFFASAPRRWPWDGPGRVISGGGLDQIVHPRLPRLITFREAARLMGFTDDWRIEPLRDTSNMAATWGKGVTVDAGRWLAKQALHALDDAGLPLGAPIGDRERLLDVSRGA